ncbi:MAG: oligosaccharide flippase family protein [bacterium]
MTKSGRYYDKLVKNAGFNFAGYFITFLLNFFSLPYIVGRLGDSAYGVLALTGSVLGYLAFLDIGMSSSLIKFVSESHARGETERIRKLLNTSIISNSVMGLIGGMALYLLAPLLATRVLHVPAALTPSAITVFRITAFTFVLNMVSSAAGSLPAALQMFFLSNLIRTVYGAVSVIVTVVVLYAGYSIMEVAATGAVLTFAVMAINILINRRLVPGYKLLPEFDRAAFSALLRFGVFTLIHKLNGILLVQFDRFLIGLFLPIGALTFYVVPAIFSGYIMRLPQIVIQVMFPLVSEINAVHGQAGEALKNIHLRASKYFIMYNLPLTVISIVLAKSILLHWMNPMMASRGAGVMAVLSAAYLVASLAFVPSVILNGVGKPEVNAYISMFTGGINLVLCLILIPRLGIIGAAYAVLISSLATAPLFVFWVQYRYIGTRFREYIISVLARPILIGVATGWALELFAPKSMGVFALLGICAVYTIIYFTLCLLAGVIDREDRDRLLAFLRSRIKR